MDRPIDIMVCARIKLRAAANQSVSNASLELRLGTLLRLCRSYELVVSDDRVSWLGWQTTCIDG